MQLPWRSTHPPVRRTARRTAWLPSATACLLAAQVSTVFVMQWVCVRGGSGRSIPCCTSLRRFRQRACGPGGVWEPLTALFIVRRAVRRLAAAVEPGCIFALAGRPLETVIGRRHLVQVALVSGAARWSWRRSRRMQWAGHGPQDLPVGGGVGGDMRASFFALACVTAPGDAVAGFPAVARIEGRPRRGRGGSWR